MTNERKRQATFNDAVRCEQCGNYYRRELVSEPKHQDYSNGSRRLYLKCPNPNCGRTYEFAMLPASIAKLSDQLDKLRDERKVITRTKLEGNVFQQTKRKQHLSELKKKDRELKARIDKIAKRLADGMILPDDTGNYSKEQLALVFGESLAIPPHLLAEVTL